jgi:streptogramin lyase
MWRVESDTILVPDPPRRTTQLPDSPSPAFGEKAERVMEYVLRFWSCKKGGPSTTTVVAPDGTVKCAECADLIRLRGSSRRDLARRGVRAAALTLALFATGLAGIARGQVITEFPVPTANSLPNGIAAGPDGNLWFTEQSGNKIGRITTASVFTEFTVPTVNSSPYGIAAGPDGNLWFTESNNGGNKIGKVTTAGVFTEFTIPTVDSRPNGIAAGPDGNVWFVEALGNKIGRVTSAGVITEFTVPTVDSVPVGIASGPDGNLWFTENNGQNIGRITTAGVFTEFPIPTSFCYPIGIAAGPDGNLWFTEGAGDKIGQVTTAGVFNEFPISTGGSSPEGITPGPDGNLWFTEFNGNQIGRITTAGVITEFLLPTPESSPFGITSGADGNIWFSENLNKIGQITTGPLTPRPMAVDAHAQTGSSSNLNGVLEPGETVQVAPTWLNTLATSQTFNGIASNLAGPPGPTYTINTNGADYGTVAAGATSDCDFAVWNCYLMTVSGARPLQHWDATFTETLGPALTPAQSGIIVLPTKIWTLHVGESFPDVPMSNQFYEFIENLFHNGVTGGCPGGNYCPSNPVTRAQMAVFLMKSKLGATEVPPPATGMVFADVPASNPFAPWIEQLAGFSITGGCGSGNYCPNNPVTRAQMAVFLLKAEHGSAYTPPACTGIFTDVECTPTPAFASTGLSSSSTRASPAVAAEGTTALPTRIPAARWPSFSSRRSD